MDSDFVVGINKSIDAAKGETGKTYPAYLHNTLVTEKLDELAEAITEGGGGASSVEDLEDVEINNPQGGQCFKYNAETGKWTNGDDAGNVQSDWNENDPSSGAYILNKPTIPAAQVQSDWNESDTTDPSYIQNKPTIPDVSTKMDKVNASGVGSFSLNRAVNTTIGNNSFAEGNICTASGTQSHAEGLQAVASGSSAHAEGSFSTASGNQAHAEGLQTTASGDNSHAEGNCTIAAGADQHVSGKFNIEDSNDTYAEIIGNGTSNSVRSNARTLDWSGNESLAGNIDAAGFGSRLAALVPSDLDDLSDVDLTNLQNGMTLKYNSGTLKFEAGVLYIEILQADYDQLSYAQKHNGIPYFITDGQGAAALPSYVDLTDILTAGNTTLTIQSPYITTAGTYDIYTDPEVPYISKVVTTGQIVITFDEQSSDLAVKVRIT